MQSLVGIYILTAVISIAIALLLVHLARLTSQARIKTDRGREKRHSSPNVLSGESLRQTIFEEINEVIDSKDHSQKVSDIVSNILNEELEKRVDFNKQELGKKYSTIIEQKEQSQNIAWKKYKKVLADKKETEVVIRSIAEGLVVVDAKGNVIMMNPAAEKLLGVSKKDKIGRPILENLKKEQLVSLAKDSPGTEGKEIEIVSKEDDTKKVLRSSSAIIEDKDGQTIGMVSVLSDVTKQRELDRMKSNFVSNVTHELRTPLIAIQKSISLLLSKTAGQISENQEQFLSIADRNLKKLSMLIDDLLDLSKFEAGKMEFRYKEIFIEEIIEEAVLNLNTGARTKSIKIEQRIDGKIPKVNVDPNRRGQVLNNLVGNAIKFTPERGNILIEASFKKDNNEVEVSVQDTGIGIGKENLSKVFGRFYQIGERTPTDISGTGVGLSITKEIIELHGGRIWAESEKGSWTRFIFRLPVKNGGKL